MTRKAYYPGKAVSAVLAGEDDLRGWSEEELIRGQRRSKYGRWHGTPPKIVPKALHDELVKRKMTKAHDLLTDNIYEAVKVLIELAKDSAVDSAIRLKAVTEILDRTIGKQPIELRVGVTRIEEAFQAMLVPTDDDATRSLPQRSKHDNDDILDAEVV